MHPVKDVVFGFKDVNIGAPPGMEDEVMSLPAVFGTHHTGMPMIVSRWRLEPHERKAIARGEDVYLCAFSHVMVPVLLTTDAPIAAQNGTTGNMDILTPDHPDYGTLTARPGAGG